MEIFIVVAITIGVLLLWSIRNNSKRAADTHQARFHAEIWQELGNELERIEGASAKMNTAMIMVRKELKAKRIETRNRSKNLQPTDVCPADVHAVAVESLNAIRGAMALIGAFKGNAGRTRETIRVAAEAVRYAAAATELFSHMVSHATSVTVAPVQLAAAGEQAIALLMDAEEQLNDATKHLVDCLDASNEMTATSYVKACELTIFAQKGVINAVQALTSAYKTSEPL